MSESLESIVKSVCRSCGNDRARMMDVVRGVQEQTGGVTSEAMDLIAGELSTQRIEVESVVSFYSFLSSRPKGQVVIRLCNDVIDKIKGVDRIAQAFCQELGIEMGQTTPDGRITLEWTACIGMSDQAPACLVNDEVFTRMNTDMAREIAAKLKGGAEYFKLKHELGDGNNADELVHSMVINNIRKAGPIICGCMEPGAAIRNAVAMTPQEVIRDMKTSRLRGRGGAGFPTGMKWDFTRGAQGATKYVLCNADEGEPGTFKDRVILTEQSDLMFEGMTIAGYAIGAREGIVYLRAEYAYLRRLLERTLSERRAKGLLGKNIAGKQGFDFDIRIQMGAGAYICGEETSLISSCEGLRGDPKTRPPFPAQKGYMGCPSTVNNVETFCCAARIMEKGPGWFAQMGSKGSPGTKLLSISGDCMMPGVYEVPFGVKLSEVLEMAGAEDTQAVQVGGPSGQMVGKAEFGRTICYDDLATGGSIMIFGPKRNVLEIANEFMEFFCDESCGYCTPCRVGNVLLEQRLNAILDGKGEPGDIEYLEDLGKTVKLASRCGLGQTSPNPILTTIKNFRGEYEKRLKKPEGEMIRRFNIHEALSDAKAITGRQSTLY
ncbi:MAG: NAD(P)H-dependent oxidoreductase subunit E [Planctomycetaceae bacterium]|nr:NAD(P)H-dependent oxidoreductase subunit E [Planctomycetaceae bacterium]